MAPTKVYIVYYSMYGHVEMLAEEIKKGAASVEGVEATLWQVPETLPEEVLGKMGAPPKSDVPIITPNELPEADGLLLGFPTRFGLMAAQFKAFMDATGSLWRTQALAGKPAGIFYSTGSQGGGQETTPLTSITQLVHHGMIFVPIGYTFGSGMFEMENVKGGSPYGAGTYAGDGSSSTLRERPSTPLRLWLCGYAFECILHMAFVFFEFRSGVRDSFSHTTYSIVKKLEPMNTLASSVWWVFGFYWIVAGGQALLEDSPRLYWLTVVFLAFDIFFIIFCIGMACVVFFALFCIIPIIALAYAMKIREGASEEDIRSLPMYMFSQSNSLVMVDDNKKQLVNARVDSCNGSHMSELSLNSDDSECCICLCPYADGAEVYRLPCTHHFHCECIGRWLRTKATCPLCKFNILRGDTLV